MEMEETITEDAAAADVEEPSEAQSQLEYTLEQEEDVPQFISVDRGRYKSKSENKIPTKKTGRESLISESPIKYATRSEAEQPNKDESSYDTPDGVALIIHKGMEEFALEIASEDYPIPEARRKLKLIGEHIKVGENPVEALSRGLKEEDPDSYKILIQALKENGYFYDRVKGYVGGMPAELSIYVVELNQSKWEHYKLTKGTEGTKAIRSLDEIVDSKKSDWAFFSDYEIILGFIGKNWDISKIHLQYPTGKDNKLGLSFHNSN